MGDRIVYTLKQTDGYAINLYSHWGGTDRHHILAHALHQSRSRWNDESYMARIILSNIIGDEWDSETGFGLWAGSGEGQVYAGDYPDIIVHLLDKTVQDETGVHDFDSYINYHSSYLLDKTENAVV